MMLFGLPPLGKIYTDPILTYFTFFLSRYPGNDLQTLCGNLFDTPVAKTIILFVIVYSSCRNWKVALLMTSIFLTLQYTMSKYNQCGPYPDKSIANTNKKVPSSCWVSNKDVQREHQKQVQKERIHVHGMATYP